MTEEVVDYSDTTRYQTLANGAIYDHGIKKIVSGKNTTSQITQAQASAYANKRWDLYQRATFKGMRNAKPSYRSHFDAIADMTTNLTLMAMDPDGGRASVEAYRAVLQAAGYMTDRRGNRQDDMGTNQDSTAGEVAIQALDIIERILTAGAPGTGDRRDNDSGDIIDGTARDTG